MYFYAQIIDDCKVLGVSFYIVPSEWPHNNLGNAPEKCETNKFSVAEIAIREENDSVSRGGRSPSHVKAVG